MRHDVDGRVVEVAARTRTIPPAIRRALHHRDRGCRFPGCGGRFVQGHHIRHWAQGGPTTLSNLALLCRRHHRAVHEEGYQVDRQPDGELRFRRPDGRLLPEVPAPSDVPADPVNVLRDGHAAEGRVLHARTAIPGWLGERLDVGWAIDVRTPWRGVSTSSVKAYCYTRVGGGTERCRRELLLTYDDYAASPDDGHRYELYEGELVTMPSPRPRHQVVIGNFHTLMADHVRGHGLGQVYLSPIDVILSRITVLQPDLVYVERAGLGIVTERAIEGAPTLVVEVLSPSTNARDRGAKQALYARYGVPFYWIVDPDRAPCRRCA